MAVTRSEILHSLYAKAAAGVPIIGGGAGTGISAKELQNLMLEKAGVATVAGTSFGIHGEGYIRFSYANSLDNIRKAVERIGTLLLDVKR